MLADLPSRWSRGNVVLAGDAAHPLLPFTSQGVKSAGGAGALGDRSAGPLDLEALQAKVSERTRLLCLWNPPNPLGRFSAGMPQEGTPPGH
jgi:flavin-dependent dehydrogenase